MDANEIENEAMMDKEEDNFTNEVSSTPSTYQNISYNAALVKTIYMKPKSPPLSTAKRVWTKCCGGCLF